MITEDPDPITRNRNAPTGDWRADRVAAAEEGRNPTVLARLASGWAVLGDTQHLPGYCVLLHHRADRVDHLTELPLIERVDFLTDMAMLGEAVQRVCAARDPAFRRINYEILGNTDQLLHAHVHARYEWEDPTYRGGPVWRYAAAVRNAPEHAFSAAHTDLQADLAAALRDLSRSGRPSRA